MAEGVWLQSLQSFLRGLLTPIFTTEKDKRMFSEFFTPKMMKIWGMAFTHETVSPTYNYEDLEYWGDSVLKYVFPKFLQMRFPDLHKGEYTELNVAYMSKVEQGKMSIQLGIPNYIRVKAIDKAGFNLAVDVFESFFGALDKISDMITPGSGAVNCFNMIVHLFGTLNPNAQRTKGAPKTQVQQMFSRFDLPIPEETSQGSELTITASPDFAETLRSVGITDNRLGFSDICNDKEAEKNAYKQVIELFEHAGLISIERSCLSQDEVIDFSVRLTDKHLEFLKKYWNINITDPIIGKAEAPTKKEAEFEAYVQALETLEKYGVTSAEVKDLKRKLDLLNPQLAPYTKDAFTRLRREGYTNMFFFIPKKTIKQKKVIVQLIGIRPDKTEEAIASLSPQTRENGYLSTKAELLRRYAAGEQF